MEGSRSTLPAMSPARCLTSLFFSAAILSCSAKEPGKPVMETQKNAPEEPAGKVEKTDA